MKKKSLHFVAAIHASAETLAEPGFVNVNQGIIMPTDFLFRHLVYPGTTGVEKALSFWHIDD